MAEERMSLEDAGRLLGGLHPNTIRARARKGKIRYETDNSGKWWVFLDPDKAANDPPRKPTKALPLEATFEATISSGFRALEVTIQALNQELEGTRAERDSLRLRASAADRLEAEAAGLQAQVADLRARLDDAAAKLDQEGEERRKLTAILTDQRDKPPAPAPEMPASGAPVARGVGWWSRLWGRAAND